MNIHRSSKNSCFEHFWVGTFSELLNSTWLPWNMSGKEGGQFSNKQLKRFQGTEGIESAKSA